ncbi:unnamed protein product [Bursaphelenchus okinawaensis]|uniref:Uncharacterized protein n=1 Tax=Bursaphelenchus okinawaensis TaxID=465554 RepID=A0A811LLH1_9BILA|nr:unnamed protein product [Bursaphelenchus okinawaensis]CAG9127773.1 unnamed protein product [Bursaphelenchus okinawaensis]
MGCSLSSPNKPKTVRETAGGGQEDDSTENEESLKQDNVSNVKVEEELSTASSISLSNVPADVELDTESSEDDEPDFLDTIDISNANRIDIELHGNSTEMEMTVFQKGTNEMIFELGDEYDVIIDRLTQCLKKKRIFNLNVYLYNQCV